MVLVGWWRILFQLYLIYSILLKSVVHKHGRGSRLSTCLVYAVRFVVFVACINGDQFSDMYVIFFLQLCTGMDEASALVHAWCMLRLLWPLLHASMVMSFQLCT